jgi:hypothetical protein
MLQSRYWHCREITIQNGELTEIIQRNGDHKIVSHSVMWFARSGPYKIFPKLILLLLCAPEVNPGECFTSDRLPTRIVFVWRWGSQWMAQSISWDWQPKFKRAGHYNWQQLTRIQQQQLSYILDRLTNRKKKKQLPILMGLVTEGALAGCRKLCLEELHNC